jgi:NAD(P)-dependent dehydrogenase (short-subunit alcohol dehydrogenase family)
LAETIGERPARFVVVGADPGALAKNPVDLDDLAFTNDHGMTPALASFAAYGRTKNMNAMFVYALAQRLAHTRITVNGAHPGIIQGTGLGKDLPPEAVAAIFSRVGVDPTSLPGPETGADTPAWLATAGEVEGVTGRFFVNREQVQTAPHTTDPVRYDRLWAESARLTGLPE